MTTFNELLERRRTVYSLNADLPVPQDEIVREVMTTTELVPDAFNMRSQRVVVALGSWHHRLWDTVYDVFGGKVPREKIESFRQGAGTVLFFCDQDVVHKTQENFPSYAPKFPQWAQQSNGMLQMSVWTMLAELGVGASLQHYNPIIDDAVANLFELPASYQLMAQMPFGGIAERPAAKPLEDVTQRFFVRR